ncbi:MAG TPA: PQQ-dependent sugar dehydrogenase [Jatrophihabitantaceae bacterium]
MLYPGHANPRPHRSLALGWIRDFAPLLRRGPRCGAGALRASAHRSPSRRHPWRVAGLIAAGGLLAACGSGAAAEPTWVPQQSISLEGGARPGSSSQQPSPGPGGSGGPGQPGGTAPGSGASPTGGNGSGSGVLAKHLTAPTGLALLPNGSALVGERTTGRILRVQPRADQPVPVVRTLPGLATSGDGGLLDLALSPTYSQDGLIYAYITTPTDNRVIDFTMTGPTAPVLTGIPRGATGNTGRLAFDGRGRLYIGTGDAGQPQLAANPTSLAGKVLRVNGIGHPAAGNPKAGSAVFASGQHTVNGLCANVASGIVYETEAPAEVNVIRAGANYGWPTPHRTSQGPASTLPAKRAGAAGCAVQQGVLFVATTTGKSLMAARIGQQQKVGAFSVVPLDEPLGRLRTVVAAPDGALWVTTTNKDGNGHPTSDDERVVRIIPTPSGGDAPPV